MPDIDFLDPKPLGLLRVPIHQRALTSSSSLSSASSYSSAGFDRLSKGSMLTNITPLITPLESVDSIFGDDPQLESLPRLSDFTWDGLTQEQWRQHVRVVQAQYAVKDVRRTILRDIDIASCIDDMGFDAAYQQDDEDFDAVSAIHNRLVKAEPTVNSQRALAIIEKRTNSSVEGRPSIAAADMQEEVEDYADDFVLGSREVFEVCRFLP